MLGGCSGALDAWSPGLPIPLGVAGGGLGPLVSDGRSGTNDHGCEMILFPLVGRERELGVLNALVDGADEPLPPGKDLHRVTASSGCHGFRVTPANQRAPCASAPIDNFATSTAPASVSRSTTVES